MAVGDLYRVALQCRVHGQLNVNTMYLKQEAGSEDKAVEVATHLLPRLAPIWQRSMGIADFDRQWTMNVTKVSRLFSDMGQHIIEVPANGQPFAGALPTVNAVVISLGTGFAGPSRRGRWFLGGVAQAHVTNSILNTTGNTVYSTFITEAAAELTAGTPASGFRLGVFSREKYKLISNPFDDYWKPCTQLTVRTIIATMHSRKIGIGS
jgi:hypothetical protein